MESIHHLPLIFMDTFDLDIKNRIDIDINVVMLLDVCSEDILVFLWIKQHFIIYKTIAVKQEL